MGFACMASNVCMACIALPRLASRGTRCKADRAGKACPVLWVDSVRVLPYQCRPLGAEEFGYAHRRVPTPGVTVCSACNR